MIDLFTNTPFVGFLVWQYVQMRKDIKEQQEKSERIRMDGLDREERTRARFEKVIKDLNTDKDQLVKQLEQRLITVETKLESVTSQINKLFLLIKKR
jgi:hypothetical protein